MIVKTHARLCHGGKLKTPLLDTAARGACGGGPASAGSVGAGSGAAEFLPDAADDASAAHGGEAAAAEDGIEEDAARL
ncbi:hypothetical protein CDD82_2511 [Ophiocordyceps australis]|uniref:Uncharacterized protein n=1 Tax=Ophiocordyceps australis TaxID=1399860 RepID=A0A2C5X788_9HYPO|nr:hypothetical protein CDD82_2511 [Ophiocordyceps australis]